MRAKFVNERQEFERGKDPIRSMDVGIDPKMVKRLKKFARRWPVTFDAIEESGIFYLGVLYDDLRMDYMIPSWVEKHLGDYLTDVNKLHDFDVEQGEQWFEIESEYGGVLKRSVEFFNNKNEEVRFERGKDPKEAMGLGLQLKRALYKNPVEIEHDQYRYWLENEPVLAKALEYDKDDPLAFTDFYGFDADWYSEEADIEQDVWEREFKATGPKIMATRSGGISVQPGELLDGSKVIYYWGGLVDGWMSRKDWLR